MGVEYESLLLFRRDVGPDKIAETMLDLGQPLVRVHNNASNDQKRLVICPRKTSLIYVYEPHKRFSFKFATLRARRFILPAAVVYAIPTKPIYSGARMTIYSYREHK